MLVKFFSKGSGGGDSPVNYLVYQSMKEVDKQGNETKVINIRDGAKVLRGNAEITRELINSTDYARRYTAGVLSFEESPKDITAQTKSIIMDNFEKTIFAGLESDQYSILWVEHTDKDLTDKHNNVVKDSEGNAVKRLELNFLIANQELRSGKRLQPYFHTADLKRVNAFQNVINMTFELSDPHDPSKRRPHNPYFSRDANLKGVNKKDYTAEQSRLTTHRNVKSEITEYMYDLAARGKLQSRQEMQDILKKRGYQVERVTKRAISVKSPKFAKNIRLDDPIFNENYKPFDYLEMNLNKKQKYYEQAKQGKILKESEAILNDGIQIKTEYHAERFKSVDMPKPFDLGWDALARPQTPNELIKTAAKDINSSPSMSY